MVKRIVLTMGHEHPDASLAFPPYITVGQVRAPSRSRTFYLLEAFSEATGTHTLARLRQPHIWTRTAMFLFLLLCKICLYPGQREARVCHDEASAHGSDPKGRARSMVWRGAAKLLQRRLGSPRNSGEEGKEAYEAVALALAVVSGSEGVQYVNNLWDANFHRLTNASFRGHPRLRTNAARCPRMHCPAASLAISIQAVRLSASIISAAG